MLLIASDFAVGKMTEAITGFLLIPIQRDIRLIKQTCTFQLLALKTTSDTIIMTILNKVSGLKSLYWYYKKHFESTGRVNTDVKTIEKEVTTRIFLAFLQFLKFW